MKKNENKYGVLEKKINEKLEKSSRLFTLIGLVLTLFLVYSFIEYETVKKKVVISESTYNMNDNTDYHSEVFEIEKIIKKEVKKIIEEPIVEPSSDNLTEIEIMSDDAKVIESDLKPKDELPTREIIELDEGGDDITEETVPFIAVEHVPVFPGCKGDKEKLIKCFSKKIRKHINKKFDSQLGEELGLSEGIKKIYVTFKIGKNGEVMDILSRAPHPKLTEEAERIMKLLPTMTPARQGTVNVGVSYSVPIVFEIQ
jgi:protein TonB